ncbi:HAMP domain-containing methyl-accepting chemotaxis protein [Helicovermis profundi]|uniref:Methyl-accepting chemotaxis protein n=1 Tax=Helicovermis profundi TaxID=3065157 RepID=A0AAU9E0X4_9FIRM|nr:methyl-accepting chemotaxis protein [Clostridia bacterium S502]
MSKKKKDKKIKKKSKQGFGIGIRILSVFLSIMIVSIFAIGFTVYHKTNTILEENLVDTSKSLNSSIDRDITHYLSTFSFVSNYLAGDTTVQQVLENQFSKTAMFRIFNEMTKNNKDIMNLYLGTADGQMLLYPKQKLPDGFDPRKRGWYEEAVNAGKLIWTDPYVDATSGELVVTVANPVYNKYNKNKLVGVLGIDINLSTLDKAISGVKIGKNGYIVLVDSKNNTMIHKSKDLIGKPIPVKALNDSLAKNSEDVVSYNYNGENKMLIYNTIEGVNWKVMSSFSMNEINEDASKNLTNIITVGLVSLLIGLILFLLFSRRLTNNIKKLLVNMEEVKKGDLTKLFNVTSTDELGSLAGFFEDTLKELSSLMRNIKNVSHELTSNAENLAGTSEEASAASDEVSRASEDIAKGAQSQAEDAGNGAEIARELADKLNVLGDNINTVFDGLKEVTNANSLGFEKINELTEKSNISKETSEETQKVVKELEVKTNDIGTILDAISAIAVQTNLLALNASIEAARAGEHGRGFAVVAEEIRKLAEESSTAADQVREIVTNIQTDSKNAVESVSQMKEISDEQLSAVKGVNDAFDMITVSVSEISGSVNQIVEYKDMIEENKNGLLEAIENISAVSEETAAASEEVNASMEQQTFAVEEVAKAAEKLNEIAVELNTEIDKFKI